MSKSFLTLLTVMLTFSINSYSQDFSISDDKVAAITEKLESFSNAELLERREFLVAQLEKDDEEDSSPVKASRSEMLFELSIIEQLLILAGVIIADNVLEDTPTPPDTVFPVITILGDNPATVELGGTYTDAGATSDGGETVSSSYTVLLIPPVVTVGTYTTWRNLSQHTE